MFFSASADALSNNIQRRNYLVAFLAGTIAGIAWWMIIDILVRSNEQLFARAFIIPGVAISVMLVILHLIPDAALYDESGVTNLFSSQSTCCESLKCARLSLFLVFLIVFTAVAASIWIFIAEYVSTDRLERKPGRVQWFGAGNMLFSILLAVVAVFSRFGRKGTDAMLM